MVEAGGESVHEDSSSSTRIAHRDIVSSATAHLELRAKTGKTK